MEQMTINMQSLTFIAYILIQLSKHQPAIIKTKRGESK